MFEGTGCCGRARQAGGLGANPANYEQSKHQYTQLYYILYSLFIGILSERIWFLTLTNLSASQAPGYCVLGYGYLSGYLSCGTLLPNQMNQLTYYRVHKRLTLPLVCCFSFPHKMMNYMLGKGKPLYDSTVCQQYSPGCGPACPPLSD